MSEYMRKARNYMQVLGTILYILIEEEKEYRNEKI